MTTWPDYERRKFRAQAPSSFLSFSSPSSFQSFPFSIACVSVVLSPHAGSGVVRIDTLRFLFGCHTRQLNQALSVSLSLDFLSVSVVLLTRAPFCIVLFCVVRSVSWSFLLGSQCQCKWLTGRLVSEMTYTVLIVTLNPAHSLQQPKPRLSSRKTNSSSCETTLSTDQQTCRPLQHAPQCVKLGCCRSLLTSN